MASPPTKTYVAEGLKISLEILQDLSELLPRPVKITVSIVKRIVDMAEVRDSLQVHDGYLFRDPISGRTS